MEVEAIEFILGSVGNCTRELKNKIKKKTNANTAQMRIAARFCLVLTYTPIRRETIHSNATTIETIKCGFILPNMAAVAVLGYKKQACLHIAIQLRLFRLLKYKKEMIQRKNI